ncbi:MAG: hypothetical protein KKH83_08960 [Candidatus Margulisbacteria bacterium]|nr:hypothetical protein [Candidatus Margulisiibacteriota bacterium]
MGLDLAGVSNVAGKNRGAVSLPGQPKKVVLAQVADTPVVDGESLLDHYSPRTKMMSAGCSADFETPKVTVGKEGVSVEGAKVKFGRGEQGNQPGHEVAQAETKKTDEAGKIEAVTSGTAVPSGWEVDFRGGHNGIRATLLDGGLIKVEEEVDTNWTCINKTSYDVPKGAQFLVVEILQGKFPKIGAEDKHGMKLMLGEKSGHPYPDYVSGSKGKHYFKIPKKLAGGTAEQLQLIFAPGKISAGAQMKVYFAKSK